jgi:hypothetical protein
MELTKAIIQASCCRVSIAFGLTLPFKTRNTDNGDGNGRQRKGIANDAADAEGRSLTVAVLHFAQRRSTQVAVRGHQSIRAERG